MWRPHNDHMDVIPFHDICGYSGWIMANTKTKWSSLVEASDRQYKRVQGIPNLLQTWHLLSHRR